MLEFLLRSRCQPIALDIGTDSIKMLQMQQVGSALAVGACGHWQFPSAPQSDAQQRHGLAVTAVRDMLRRNGFKGRKVISSISSSQLVIKNVRVPHMSEAKLQEALSWEAKDRFDFEVRPDQLSYINAGEVRQGNETRDEIILLAAPPSAIEEQLGMLDEMGLRAEHLDAEPIALFRVFERFLRRRNDEQAVSVILDLGYGATRVVVARGRQIVFLKVIDIGGKKFTEVVANHLNLSYTEAQELRQRIMCQRREETNSSDPAPSRRPDANSVEWTIYDALRADVEALAKEIALCVRYCSVTFRGLRCQQISLTGGEAYDPVIGDVLSQSLGIACTIAPPLRGIDISGLNLANRRGMLAEWAVCAGMAIRNVDQLVSAVPKEAEHAEPRLSA